MAKPSLSQQPQGSKESKRPSVPLGRLYPFPPGHAAGAAAKSLQLCPTLCDPIDGSPPGSAAAHQSPPSLGFSRQEHWSGVAISFSNAWKWKWSCSAVSDSSWPHGLQPTRLLHPWDLPGKSIGVGCHCLLQQETQAGSIPGLRRSPGAGNSNPF